MPPAARIVAIAVFFSMALAPTAIAEPSFSGGQLRLPTYGPADRNVQACTYNERRIFVAGQFGRSHAGSGWPWRRGNRLATISLSHSPKTERDVAVASWRKQRIPRGEIVFSTQFDSAGRLYYVTGKANLRGKSRRLHVLRSTPGGKPDRSFGRKGVIKLTGVSRAVRSHRNLKVRVVATGRRPVIVLSNGATTEIHRVNRRGVDRNWRPYRVNLNVASTVSVNSGGSVFAGAIATVAGRPQPGIGLIRLLPNGLPDSTFGSAGTWKAPRIDDAATAFANVPAIRTPGLSRATVPTADGGVWVDVVENVNANQTQHTIHRIVKVDATGNTAAVSQQKGTFTARGDVGLPIASPSHFESSKQGAVLAMASGWFSGTSATTVGFGASTIAGSRLEFEESGFAATAFGGSKTSAELLACGNPRNKKTGEKRQREIALRTIAIR